MVECKDWIIREILFPPGESQTETLMFISKPDISFLVS